ncbi:MAG: hypothetical protein ACK5RL_07995 [Acidimicrobiales bacterium]
MHPQPSTTTSTTTTTGPGSRTGAPDGGAGNRNRTTWARRVGALLVAAMIVAGCGNGDETGADATADSASTSGASDDASTDGGAPDGGGTDGDGTSTDAGADGATEDGAGADDGRTGDELVDAVTATAAAPSSTVTITVSDGEDAGTGIAVEAYGEDRRIGIGPAASGEYSSDEGPDEQLVKAGGEWYYRSVVAGDDRWFTGATPVDDDRLSLPEGFDPESSPVTELPALIEATDPIETVGPGRYLGDVDGDAVDEPGSLLGLATATGCTDLSALIELSGDDVTRVTLTCRADTDTGTDDEGSRSVVALISALGTTEEITAPTAS